MPVLDGLPYGLAHGATANSTQHNGSARTMAMSTGDISLVNGPMSRSSFASFHLTGKKIVFFLTFTFYRKYLFNSVAEVTLLGSFVNKVMFLLTNA